MDRDWWIWKVTHLPLVPIQGGSEGACWGFPPSTEGLCRTSSAVKKQLVDTCRQQRGLSAKMTKEKGRPDTRQPSLQQGGILQKGWGKRENEKCFVCLPAVCMGSCVFVLPENSVSCFSAHSVSMLLALKESWRSQDSHITRKTFSQTHELLA